MPHDLLLVWMSTFAEAQGRPVAAPVGPVVGVVGVHQRGMDAEDQRRAIASLTAAIEAAGAFDARGPDELAPALAGREAVVLEQGLLAEPRAWLLRARVAVDQASFEEANTYAELAIGGIEDVFPGTNQVADLWEAHLARGAALLLQEPSDPEAASAAFVDAVAVAPDRLVDPAAWPPRVLEVFSSARAASLAGSAPLTVRAPSGRVFVDGRDRGLAPVTVTVPPGPHHVAVLDGGLRGAAQVVVASGTPAEVPVTLAAPSLGVAAEDVRRRSAQASALYGALGHWLVGVDYLVLAGVEEQTLHLQLLRTATGAFSAVLDVPVEGHADDEAVTAVPTLLAAIGADGSLTSSAPGAAPLALDEAVSLASWWCHPEGLGPTDGKKKRR